MAGLLSVAGPRRPGDALGILGRGWQCPLILSSVSALIVSRKSPFRKCGFGAKNSYAVR